MSTSLSILCPFADHGIAETRDIDKRKLVEKALDSIIVEDETITINLARLPTANPRPPYPQVKI